MDKHLKELIKFLNKNGFKKESKEIIKISVPIGDFYDPPGQKEDEEIYPSVDEVRNNKESYRDFFIDLKQFVDIFFIPRELIPFDSGALPSQDMNPMTVPVSKEERETAILQYDFICNDGKSMVDKIDISKIKDFIDYVSSKAKNDRLSIVWGGFDPHNGEPVSFGPEWFAHDIFHAAEAFSIIHPKQEKIRTLSDLYAKTAQDSINVDKFMILFNLLEEYTNEINDRDWYQTLFGLQMTNNVSNEIKNCFISPEKYNNLTDIAKEIMEAFKGYIIWLP